MSWRLRNGVVRINAEYFCEYGLEVDVEMLLWVCDDNMVMCGFVEEEKCNYGLHRLMTINRKWIDSNYFVTDYAHKLIKLILVLLISVASQIEL